jgi:hypothetical protein
MFDAFWSDFKWKIFGFCFVPYLLYFFTSLTYLVLMLHTPDEEALDWGYSSDDLYYMEKYETPTRTVFGVLLFFQMGIQIKQMSNDGLKRHLR